MFHRIDNPNRNRGFLSRFILSQKALAVLGFLILTAIAIPLGENISRRRQLEKEISEMQKEVSRVENKNNNLRKLLEYFESEQFLEEQARMNFGLKKDGEQVAIIKNSAPAAGSGVQASSSPQQTIFNIPGLENGPVKKPETNFDRWLKHFLQ